MTHKNSPKKSTQQQIWEDPALLDALSTYADPKTRALFENQVHDSLTDEVEIKRIEHSKPTKRTNRSHLFAWSSLAATLLLTCWFWFVQNEVIEPIVLKQPVVNHLSESVAKKVTLPDGSQLAMNRHAQVQYVDTSNQRRVTLTKGEVFFNVAKNPSHPFVITSRDIVITVVGTAFNVDVFDGGSQLEVFHGKVKVKNRHSGEERELTKGRGLILNDKGNFEDTLFNDETPLWQQGWVAFSSTPLSQAVSKLNVYADKPVILTPGLEGLSVSGRFKTSDIGAAVNLIAAMHSLKVTEYADSVMIEKAL